MTDDLQNPEAENTRSLEERHKINLLKAMN